MLYQHRRRHPRRKAPEAPLPSRSPTTHSGKQRHPSTHSGEQRHPTAHNESKRHIMAYSQSKRQKRTRKPQNITTFTTPSLPVVRYLYAICTVFVRFFTVQVLYIYCTYSVQRAVQVGLGRAGNDFRRQIHGKKNFHLSEKYFIL